MAVKLLELGCFPGREIRLIRSAPFNGPSYLKINGSNVALRKNEAENILVSSNGSVEYEKR
jgi:ferrous iron transport protein A